MTNQVKLIEQIQKVIKEKGYEPHREEWNIANQLIDIVAVDSRAAELVLQDLSVPEMSVDTMVREVSGKRGRNPVTVMEQVAKFYGIDTPAFLPPEYWRGASCAPITVEPVPIVNKPPAPSKITPIKFSLADLMK